MRVQGWLGVVTLFGVERASGSVDDRIDEFTALATVRVTPGARDIVDDLEVALPPLSSAR